MCVLIAVTLKRIRVKMVQGDHSRVLIKVNKTTSRPVYNYKGHPLDYCLCLKDSLNILLPCWITVTSHFDGNKT